MMVIVRESSPKMAETFRLRIHNKLPRYKIPAIQTTLHSDMSIGNCSNAASRMRCCVVGFFDQERVTLKSTLLQLG